ncbi:MAG: response regulator transcription factor [Chloroflexota bacterium]
MSANSTENEPVDPTATIRTVLVDDHHVVRRALHSFLNGFPDIELVGEAATGEEALAGVDVWLPDVVVMDLHMPGGIDGIETTKHLRIRSPHTKVVVLTAHTDEARVLGALREGATGYVRKDADPDLLLAAVRGAARGQAVLDPNVAGAVLHELVQGSDAYHKLTKRENEVLRQLAHGKTNRQIAEALTVSDETIKTHIGNILTKLHLAHRTQAALYALKHGLVTVDELEL